MWTGEWFATGVHQQMPAQVSGNVRRKVTLITFVLFLQLLVPKKCMSVCVERDRENKKKHLFITLSEDRVKIEDQFRGTRFVVYHFKYG